MFPFAKYVPRIRLSMDSSNGGSDSLCAGFWFGAKKSLQHPLPSPGNTIWVSLTHSPSGLLPALCCPSGGTPYSSTVRRLFFNSNAGEAVLIDEVLVTAQTPRFVLCPLPCCWPGFSSLVRWLRDVETAP